MAVVLDQERAWRLWDLDRQTFRQFTSAFHERDAIIIERYVVVTLGFEIVEADGNRGSGSLRPPECQRDPVPLFRPVPLESGPGFIRGRILGQRIEVAVEIGSQSLEFCDSIVR